MPWCPQCKEEYKEGITECPDCRVPLVESLEKKSDSDGYVSVYSFEDTDLADKFSSYLVYAGIRARSEEQPDGSVSILVREKDVKETKKLFSGFYSVEASNSLREELQHMREFSDDPKNPYEYIDEEIKKLETDNDLQKELTQMVSDIVPAEPYERRVDKANDTLSTAVIFLAFGAVGILIILLSALKVITFFRGPVFFIFATLMFGGFLAVSYMSYKSYKQYKAEADQEEEFIKALSDWLDGNFKKSDLEAYLTEIRLDPQTSSEEEKYFAASNKIKSLLVSQFGEMDESFLEFFTDDYYNKRFD